MKKILICTNYRANPNQPSCAARGSQLLIDDLAKNLCQAQTAITLEPTSCLGYCSIGINLKLSPSGRFVHHLANSEASIASILKLVKQFTD